MILLNLTAHLALSGSLFTLRSGASEAAMGVYMALFAAIPLFTSLRVGSWIDRAGARHLTRHVPVRAYPSRLPPRWACVYFCADNAPSHKPP